MTRKAREVILSEKERANLEKRVHKETGRIWGQVSTFDISFSFRCIHY